MCLSQLSVIDMYFLIKVSLLISVIISVCLLCDCNYTEQTMVSSWSQVYVSYCSDSTEEKRIFLIKYVFICFLLNFAAFCIVIPIYWLLVFISSFYHSSSPFFLTCKFFVRINTNY